MSSSPDRVRVRGRSPAFNALASKFESPNVRNVSTPPPLVPKLYPKSVTPDSGELPKPRMISALAATFDKPPPALGALFARTVKVSPIDTKKIEAPIPEANIKQVEIEDDDDDEGLTVYPYERLRTTSINPVTDIDTIKRESYLSSAEFREKFGMPKTAFYKLPKWKQNKLKMALQLF